MYVGSLCPWQIRARYLEAPLVLTMVISVLANWQRCTSPPPVSVQQIPLYRGRW
jgi:hypothetical protein